MAAARRAEGVKSDERLDEDEDQTDQPDEPHERADLGNARGVERRVDDARDQVGDRAPFAEGAAALGDQHHQDGGGEEGIGLPEVGEGALQPGRKAEDYRPQPWDSDRLTFAVREPFPSKSSTAGLVFGSVTAEQPLTLRSRMPEHGVIFSDGMEADFLRFTAGMEATITVAGCRGQLAV